MIYLYTPRSTYRLDIFQVYFYFESQKCMLKAGGSNGTFLEWSQIKFIQLNFAGLTPHPYDPTVEMHRPYLFVQILLAEMRISEHISEDRGLGRIWFAHELLFSILQVD